jgi:hypothetical protein
MTSVREHAKGTVREHAKGTVREQRDSAMICERDSAVVNAWGVFGERSCMAHSKLGVLRVIAAAALGAAALFGPVLATLGASGESTNSATGECLAWFGSRGDGICMGYSTGNGVNVGTPDFGIYGPGYGYGITSGPLLPGQTINQGITP